MKLEVTGRHVEVTPALKTFTVEKIAKLAKWIDDPIEAHVICTVEKHRHIAEIVVHGRHVTLSSRVVTADMYTSVGECVDKLERQAKKHKEKFEARRRRGAAATARLQAAPRAPAARRGPSRRAASAAGRGASAPPGSRTLPPRIVRVDTFPRKPMTVEEAALQARDAELGFFVFRNERSREVNVLFRRRDGSLGLIEPEG